VESGELAAKSEARKAESKGHGGECAAVDVLVPVAEWRVWRHGAIKDWTLPDEVALPESIRVFYLPVFYLPLVGRSFSWLFYRLAFMRRRDLFDSCDAVLGSWLYPDCVAANAVAEICGKPFYARLHGTDRFHLDAAFRAGICSRTLNAAKEIFVNAEFMREELVKRNVCESKISVVRNGVDRDLFRARTAPEIAVASDEFGVEFGELFNEDVCSFLWIGNLVGIKGPDVAIKAFAKSREQRDKSGEGTVAGGEGAVGRAKGGGQERDECEVINARLCRSRLVFIGDGPMRCNLELLARELGVEDCVIFCGSIPHKDIALWMNLADCLLLTSFSEGMPNVVIEALASGIPVVSTDVGDVATVVRNGLNGYVVPAGTDETVDCLGEALKKVLAQEWNPIDVQESVDDFDWQRSAELVMGKIK